MDRLERQQRIDQLQETIDRFEAMRDQLVGATTCAASTIALALFDSDIVSDGKEEDMLCVKDALEDLFFERVDPLRTELEELEWLEETADNTDRQAEYNESRV